MVCPATLGGRGPGLTTSREAARGLGGTLREGKLGITGIQGQEGERQGSAKAETRSQKDDGVQLRQQFQ